MCRFLHKLIAILLFISALGAAPAVADAPVSLGTGGSLQRAGLTQDALKNGTSASFGSPVTDDRRLFKLRWRLPWLFVAGGGAVGFGAAPFAGGFSPIGGAAPGGASFASETMSGLSALIPTFAIGESKKLAQLQLGALSTSIGHGTLVDRYSNSPEGMKRAAGIMAEVNLAGLGAQILVGDFADPKSTIAARVYGRPVLWFAGPDATFQPNELDIDPRTEVAGMWVTGVSGAIDADAPLVNGRRQSVWAVGWDNEAAVFDNQLWKTIASLDLNALATKDGARPGFGAHPGATFMLDFFGSRVDLTPEMNFGTDGYVPRYFDRLYRLERSTVLGSGKPKLELERPSSWGWQVRSQASLLKSLSVFAEAGDQFAFDPSRGGNSGHVTMGASAWLLFLGGSVVATQTGITDWSNPGLTGPGFVLTGEARIGVLLNTLHIVGRGWRAHIAAGNSPDDYVVNTGATIGVEANFDLL